MKTSTERCLQIMNDISEEMDNPATEQEYQDTIRFLQDEVHEGVMERLEVENAALRALSDICHGKDVPMAIWVKFMKKLVEMGEERGDKRIIQERANEPTIPAEDVYREAKL